MNSALLPYPPPVHIFLPENLDLTGLVRCREHRDRLRLALDNGWGASVDGNGLQVGSPLRPGGLRAETKAATGGGCGKSHLKTTAGGNRPNTTRSNCSPRSKYFRQPWFLICFFVEQGRRAVNLALTRSPASFSPRSVNLAKSLQYVVNLRKVPHQARVRLQSKTYQTARPFA